MTSDNKLKLRLAPLVVGLVVLFCLYGDFMGSKRFSRAYLDFIGDPKNSTKTSTVGRNETGTTSFTTTSNKTAAAANISKPASEQAPQITLATEQALSELQTKSDSEPHPEPNIKSDPDPDPATATATQPQSEPKPEPKPEPVVENPSQSTPPPAPPEQPQGRLYNSEKDDIHQGARFPNGTMGYIVDVYKVRNAFIQRYRDSIGDTTNTAMPPLSYMPISPGGDLDEVCNKPLRQGAELIGWPILFKIVPDSPNPTKQNEPNVTKVDNVEILPTTPQPRITLPEDGIHKKSNGTILCIVISHAGAHDRLEGIRDTWGWRCDGFFAASTKTGPDNDPSSLDWGTVDIPHRFDESYRNLWQKMRSNLGYTYDNFLNQFDYFYIANDDAHVIIENMRRFLGVLEIRGLTNDKRPLLTGNIISQKPHRQKFGLYVGGGSGYLLNRLGLKLVVEAMPRRCSPNEQTSADDRFLGMCFWQNSGDVTMTDSVDDTGRPRFHGYTPHQYFEGNPNDIKKSNTWEFWKHGPKYREDAFSIQSVALHKYKYTRHKKRVHAIIYRSCPSGTVLGDLLPTTTTTTQRQSRA
ncbi:acetylgalactosamine 3-beta-galactosyltransferase 1 [Seminavis robusta]|uniref:Acetylgalactosamine 3-beta-galactosyltransferase 1 n=1 Tax=Seminavis robusta TaxID=568900 RepID=A0A9N8DW32_9STRA|nr:acetylgalactosamine 3-beta-galactosyltransferase 1 [Seminavis robusta]|eukprot:Sro338_g120750.1 acetylgalactosamine 3-beta-galactosyltransferase 1 (580) ;mRNA; r:1512-3251